MDGQAPDLALLGITSEGDLVKGLLQLLSAEGGSCQQSDSLRPMVIVWAFPAHN